MVFQHFLHNHKLSSKAFEEDDMKQCVGCLDIIVGPAYYCQEWCGFWMHKSCAEMPPQIQKHIVHPHPLEYNLAGILVCDACRKFTFSVIWYKCMYCELKLDFKCAMTIFNDETEIGKLEHQGATVQHFCHPHQLIRCMLSSTTEEEKMTWTKVKLRCGACNLELPGTALLIHLYACMLCLFFIHESCTNEMPTQVQWSPFHPHHVLHPRPFIPSKRRQVWCYACSDVILGFSFYCEECDVNLHVSCAMYRTRSIKHSCHPHDLLQLGKSIIHNISCDACGEDCYDSCFSCKKCDFNIHLQCIPLPSSFKHKHHSHPLALVNSFVEDDSGDYCCDMCETERNPDLQVYYCEECNYITHIDCVLSEVLKPTKGMLLHPQRVEENSDDQSLEMGERVNHETIQRYSFHHHPLILDESRQMFVCDGCKELCIDSSYSCTLCSFNLCSKCATLDNKIQHVKTTFTHFSHYHPFTRCKINILQVDVAIYKCMACRQRLNGITYACLVCDLFLHESCLKDMLQNVQSLFHLQHPLRTYTFMNSDRAICGACNQIVHDLVFRCFTCDFKMHYSCAKYQFREVKHDCHAGHRLLHLGKGLFGDESPKCNVCDQSCDNTLFCCFKCKFYIHLECIPLPAIVKHKRHSHSLTLTTVIEDDSGDYCCDTCETQRNPEHDVYHCKECNYISHIDCIISEVEPPEEIFQYLPLYPKKV